MSKLKENPLALNNLICTVLMMALLVCYFLPFWNVDGQTASIGGYIWMPENHQNITEYFRLNSEEFLSSGMNSIVGMPILLLVTCGIGIFCGIVKPSSLLTPVMGMVCCISGLVGFLGEPIFRMGGSWILMLILCVAIGVAAAASVPAMLQKIKKAVV